MRLNRIPPPASARPRRRAARVKKRLVVSDPARAARARVPDAGLLPAAK
jgi:hypothetical protein